MPPSEKSGGSWWHRKVDRKCDTANCVAKTCSCKLCRRKLNLRQKVLLKAWESHVFFFMICMIHHEIPKSPHQINDVLTTEKDSRPKFCELCDVIVGSLCQSHHTSTVITVFKKGAKSCIFDISQSPLVDPRLFTPMAFLLKCGSKMKKGTTELLEAHASLGTFWDLVNLTLFGWRKPLLLPKSPKVIV